MSATYICHRCGQAYDPVGCFWRYHESAHCAFAPKAEAYIREQFGVVDASGRLIAPPQTPIVDRPDGPHRSNGDAREPVRE